MQIRVFLSLILLCCWACNSDQAITIDQAINIEDTLPFEPVSGSHFELLSPEQSGIDFNNLIKEDEEFNHLVWESVFYGGGVAVGDLNNDGLSDLYFTGNQVDDAIYLNKGNLQFEEVSQKAEIPQKSGWSTGVTMVDINADGWLDIYICKSGWKLDNENIELRKNQLLINNQDMTFTDKASEYGLDDSAHSTQASFFDYDQDGDLDLYLMNMPSNNFKQKMAYIENEKIPYQFSDKLYENIGQNKFKDRTKKAGIENYAFGLGMITTDINWDGWIDIYVACDYEQPDKTYINNKDGTFTDRSNYYFKHTSYSSMGCDVADINNDVFPDVAVLDMQAADHIRSKTNMRAMNAKNFWQNVEKGYGFQYMSNTLQLNTGMGFFSEIGQLAGISNTDWSWSILMADFDNDAHKDIFVSNGVNRDMRNSDLVDKMKNISAANRKKTDMLNLAKSFPSERLPNYLFKNNDDLSFENKAEKWGLSSPGFSYGAAYEDLDQDGDLDLIVCNSNQYAQIFKNKNPKNNNWLQVSLKGANSNLNALGSKVIIYYGEHKQYQELTLTRGYQSSIAPNIHFGLGKINQLDSLIAIFPNNRKSVLKNVKANQKLLLTEKDALLPLVGVPLEHPPYITDITRQSGIDFKHQENRFDDFSREILLPHMQSRNGPNICTGDVDGDQREDFYVGGASGQAGQLYSQMADGTFRAKPQTAWEKDKDSEDIGCVLVDIDGDKDLDLYVVSGGGEHPTGHNLLQDRLYINDGNGNFQKVDQIPSSANNGSCVRAADFDKDGDIDIFIGGNVIPGKYPQGDKSVLLVNTNGTFKDGTDTYAPELSGLGIVTDAIWSDYDKDGYMDLIVVGEWSAPEFFHNQKGKLINVSSQVLSEDLTGWWHHINPTDIDNDGDIDFVIGNMGLNNKYHPNADKPLYIYSKDFDNNNTNDVVLAKKSASGTVPVRGRECSSEQMPFIAEKFGSYQSFANASLDDIYGEELQSAIQYTAKEFRTGLLINDGSGHFNFNALPNEAQISPVMGSVVHDFNKDGKLDIALAGNHFDAEVETVRHDAGNGLVLLASGKGQFEAYPAYKAGFYLPFNTKGLSVIQNYKKDKGLILAANNNTSILAYTFEK